MVFNGPFDREFYYLHYLITHIFYLIAQYANNIYIYLIIMKLHRIILHKIKLHKICLC